MLERVRNNRGFSYIELMAGMGILLLAVSLFTGFYRFSSKNKIQSREMTAMATAAQNVMTIYSTVRDNPATPENEEAAVKSIIQAELQEEGFAYQEGVTLMEAATATAGLKKIIVVIQPRSSMKNLQNYVLVFYSLAKSNYR